MIRTRYQSPLSTLAAAATFLVSANVQLQGQAPPDREGLTLQNAVVRALDHHPSAISAEAAVSAAEAAVGEATASRLPQIGFEASATRYQEPMIVAPLHALDITQAPEFNNTLLRGTASVSYILFDGGARGSHIRMSRAEAGAAESTRESVEAAVIAAVANTYLRVLTARDVLAAHDSLLSALNAERTRISQLFEEGTAAQVDVLRVNAAISKASAERVSATAALDISVRGLARLTGVDESEISSDRLIPVRLLNENPDRTREDLLQQAAATNPELKRAEDMLLSARTNRSAAKAAWLPNVSLFGGYLGFGSGAGELVTEWQGGAKISYPVFTGGARSRRVARTNALAEIARQEVRQVELSVGEGVDRGINSVREASARVAAVEEAVSHLAEVARIEQLALQAGAGTQPEYLRSEAELLQARASLIEARNNEIAARIELARVLGTLSQEWLGLELENTP